MDKELKNLLIEVAKTVLRVLDKPAVNTSEVPTPWATATNPEAVRSPLPAPAPVRPNTLDKGTVVRFWDGNKYVVGTVISLCRNKGGTLASALPARANVRVEKANGRGKTYRVEVSRCELVKVTP